MQRNIRDKIFLDKNVSPFDNAGESDAIDRTTKEMMTLKKKFKKLENLLKQEIMMLILLIRFLVFSK